MSVVQSSKQVPTDLSRMNLNRKLLANMLIPIIFEGHKLSLCGRICVLVLILAQLAVLAVGHCPLGTFIHNSFHYAPSSVIFILKNNSLHFP